MRLSKPLAFRCTLAFIFTASLSVQSILAQDYSVVRNLDQDPTTCTGDGSAAVTLTGFGPGAPTDLLTVTEPLVSLDRINDFVVSAISSGGTLTETAPPSIGVFNERRVVEQPTAPSPGTNNSTVHNGGDSYTSTSETGRDIWADGDTFEFAYTRFNGDFDTSVRIDDYNHETNIGCWGKYGIMARQTLDHNSRMLHVENHGPFGTPGGVQNARCAEITTVPSQSTSVLGRRDHLSATTFEAVVGEPSGGEFPAVYANFDYMRLTRRGNLLEGWVTNDPTNDANWTKLEIGDRDGGDFFLPPDAGDCWYVGFGNSENSSGGADVQAVEFTVLRWEGESCFVSSGLTRKAIVWTDVPRSDVDAGLSYNLTLNPELDPLDVNLAEGQVHDGAKTSAIAGPTRVGLVEVQSVGGFLTRALGPTGGGTVSVDGSVFEMTGRGTDDFTDDNNTLKVLFLGQGDIPHPGPLPDESHPCGTDPTSEDPGELTCDTYEPTLSCP